MRISLPLETESTRCSDFARINQVDPGGTALAPDVLVVAEVDEPWPKPVAKHGDLQALTRVAATHSESVRLLAAIPKVGRSNRLIAFRSARGGMTRCEVELGADPAADLHMVLNAANGLPVVGLAATRTVLVCTQGTHDQCCGSLGAELADTLGRVDPDLEVFRVSHTGGHRFAPTAMTLPDGRMWAYLTGPTLASILDRSLDPAAAASICRGWWGAAIGPAQVAERAVFAKVGWRLDGLIRSVSIAGFDDQQQHRVVVATHDPGAVDRDGADRLSGERWEALVVEGREVPAIACEAPGGLPVKRGREWQVVRGPERLR